MSEALFSREAGAHSVVASGALSSGEITQLGDGRAAYAEGLQAIASGDELSQRHAAIVRAAAASGTTFSKGDPVYWDASANLAVNPALTLAGSEDFYLGVATLAKVSGETTVSVELNAQPLLPGIQQPFVREFDCEDGADETASVKNIHTLIPANHNKRGLLVVQVFALVTEAFGGATEDQGVVTITDSDGNSICTITVADGGADAVNDYRVGTGLFAASAGDAAKVVAAGKSIRGQVTQETNGASAGGKLKVYALVTPLV